MTTPINIYLDHFGLSERPFSLVPDPDFLYWSRVHQRAFAMLEYGILTHAPITLITGEVGAGKTTLMHHLLRTLPAEVRVGLVSNAHGDRGELLRWVLQSLDQTPAPGATYVELFGQFEQFLIDEYRKGHSVIVIFDEAQNLSLESLEELRMFTNINSNKDELLQLILVGQPELRETVNRPSLRQFAQRVASSFHLPALDAAMISDYIGHRMARAGARTRIFAPGTAALIHATTGGVPRLVNQLCDLSLLYAYTEDQDRVTPDTVNQVLKDGVFFAGGAPLSEEDMAVYRTSDP